MKPRCDVTHRGSHGANCASKSLALQELRWTLTLEAPNGSASITDAPTTVATTTTDTADATSGNTTTDTTIKTTTGTTL